MPNIRAILPVEAGTMFPVKMNAFKLGMFWQDLYVWDGDSTSFLGDGVNKRLLTDSPFFNVSGAFSGSIWIKSVTVAGLNSIFARDAAGGVQRSWNLVFRNTDNKIRFFFWNANNTINELLGSTAGATNDGLWHHIVFTFDGVDAIKLYIDGVLDNSMTTASTGVAQYTGSSAWVSLLGHGAVTPGWCSNWYTDEPALWDGIELSLSDVSEIYNSGSPGDLDLITNPPSHQFREEFGDFNVFWTVPDVMSTGINMISQNMVFADRTAVVP